MTLRATLKQCAWLLLAFLSIASGRLRFSMDTLDDDEYSTKLDSNGPTNQLRCFSGIHEIMNDRHNPCANGHIICRTQEICGKTPALKKKHSKAHVQDGLNIKYGEWPFYAKVKIGDEFNIKSGVLVSDRHVLTLASSFAIKHSGKLPDGNATALIEAHRFEIHLGDHIMYKLNASQKVVGVKRSYRSQKFSVDSREFDWALLELQNPIASFTDYIQPACLPFKPVKHTGDQSDCFMVVPSEGNSIGDQQVQRIRVQQIPCDPSLNIEDSDGSRECYAGWPSSRGDICRGDHGAPIFCLAEGNRWTVMALKASRNMGEDFSLQCKRSAYGTGLIVTTKLETLLVDIMEEVRVE